jgi:hypothetical protein
MFPTSFLRQGWAGAGFLGTAAGTSLLITQNNSWKENFPILELKNQYKAKFVYCLTVLTEK